MYEEMPEEDIWESRDRKVENRRKINNLNKDYRPGPTKKTQKPRVTENRKLADLESDDSMLLDD